MHLALVQLKLNEGKANKLTVFLEVMPFHDQQ